MTADLIQRAFDGQPVRMFTDEQGETWFVATDIARILGYGDATHLTRRLDSDEKGLRSVETLGGPQSMAVITEPGLHAAILGSRVEGAKAFKRWVTHDVLPSIRRTGSYSTTPALSEDEIVHAALQITARKVEELTAQVVALTPSAAAWDTLVAETAGDWSLRDAAQMLARDPAVSIGQNRLAKYLRQIGWCDTKGIAYQKQVDLGRLDSKPQWRTSHRTGERVACDPQTRITLKGLSELHRRLGGTAPLDTTPVHTERASA